MTTTLQPSPRYQWRASHSITVWFHPNRDEIGEWHACIGDRANQVTADTEDAVERAICEKHHIKHWRDLP